MPFRCFSEKYILNLEFNHIDVKFSSRFSEITPHTRWKCRCSLREDIIKWLDTTLNGSYKFQDISTSFGYRQSFTVNLFQGFQENVFTASKPTIIFHKKSDAILFKLTWMNL
jgi:hypothetical protein